MIEVVIGASYANFLGFITMLVDPQGPLTSTSHVLWSHILEAAASIAAWVVARNHISFFGFMQLKHRRNNKTTNLDFDPPDITLPDKKREQS